MSIVHELYGKALAESGDQRGSFREAACPYMSGEQCDGGGNRDMARWSATAQPLAPFFDSSVGVKSGGWIPCGVCSVEIAGQAWAICPRRLLTIDSGEVSNAQLPLVRRILQLGGFSSGETVQVWSEVQLRSSSENLNYRLDYVLVGDSGAPVIVEVMTASTSGGNKAKRTDIQSAFCDAVLYAEGVLQDRSQSPGVNARQVWARMASQLVVKSQIANAWGGRTIWVVQDTLASYMRDKTGLRLDEMRSTSWQTAEVNVLSVNIHDFNELTLYSGPIHSHDGSACWDELLDTPSLPAAGVLAGKLETGSKVAEFLIP